MRSFDTWTYEQVEDTFGISPLRTSPNYEEWLKAKDLESNNLEISKLDELKELLFCEVNNWNSDELMFFFIAPVLNLIHFYTANFKPFTQRTLSITHGDVSASGKVDFMLAKGKQTPKIPYFCLHEYKQENRRDNDPLGQLLIGMVAAQNKNGDKQPIYGSYVSGRNRSAVRWFFVMLEEDHYILSDAYVASSDDLYKIFAILKNVECW